jgi:hypothetical protein
LPVGGQQSSNFRKCREFQMSIPLILESEGCGIATTSLSTGIREQKQCPEFEGIPAPCIFSGKNQRESHADFFCGANHRSSIRWSARIVKSRRPDDVNAAILQRCSRATNRRCLDPTRPKIRTADAPALTTRAKKQQAISACCCHADLLNPQVLEPKRFSKYLSTICHHGI